MKKKHLYELMMDLIIAIQDGVYYIPDIATNATDRISKPWYLLFKHAMEGLDETRGTEFTEEDFVILLAELKSRRKKEFALVSKAVNIAAEHSLTFDEAKELEEYGY